MVISKVGRERRGDVSEKGVSGQGKKGPVKHRKQLDLDPKLFRDFHRGVAGRAPALNDCSVFAGEN